MLKVLGLVMAMLVAAMPPASAASITGTQGQVLFVPKTTLKSGEIVTVTGKYFDETVGIYLAFCVIPKAGKAPTPCGGGVNKAGTGESSYWISSNPPPYATGLTDEFKTGGRFSMKVKVSKKIGNIDCTKVKCAITVRADHLRSNDRSHDLFIPIKIK